MESCFPPFLLFSSYPHLSLLFRGFGLIKQFLGGLSSEKGEHDEKAKNIQKTSLLGSIILLNDLSFFFFFNFRLYLKGHTGTAGKQSSLILHGADFSTKDADNDNCMCKCALMLTGGKSYGAIL